jgi:murein DD-endopeptidase MepM/ murein hydrolase activator NlpD
MIRHLILPILCTGLLAQSQIEIAINPSPCYIEHRASIQLVNCDILVRNKGQRIWTMREFQVSVRDHTGKLVFRKFLSDNGTNPSIETVPNRAVAAGADTLYFNPLFEFAPWLEITELHFVLTFSSEKDKTTTTAEASVKPVDYKDKTILQLPLRGRFVVWDGHDFLSHHRRWDYVLAPIRKFGFDSNAGRYSYDFVLVDSGGEMHSGAGKKNEDWLGFGTPIFATAFGKVVAVEDSNPDDRQLNFEAMKKNLLAEFGNYVVIDHQNGEFSLFGHIQQHSAQVKVGDSVKGGQTIARVGASGSSLFPHLHYQLQNSPNGHAEGLPSYFRSFVRSIGNKRKHVAYGQVDSGEFLESAIAKQIRPAQR